MDGKLEVSGPKPQLCVGSSHFNAGETSNHSFVRVVGPNDLGWTLHQNKVEYIV